MPKNLASKYDAYCWIINTKSYKGMIMTGMGIRLEVTMRRY